MRSTTFTKYKHLLKNIPHSYWLIGGVLFAFIVAYSVAFLPSKNVNLSYAGDTCIRQNILLPGAQQANSDDFTVTLHGEVKIGSLPIAATGICVSPNNPPETGTYAASLKPFGLPVAATNLAVTVGEAPVARASDIIGKEVSPALPLIVSLTEPDTLHTYALSVGEAKATCKSAEAQLECDVAALQLEPGKQYQAALTRAFKDSAETPVVKGEFATLVPIVLTEQTVQADETRYDEPKEFRFTFDQTVDRADVSLSPKTSEESNETKSGPKVSAKTEENTVIVLVEETLDRKAEYTLTLNQVVATSGSALEAPVAIPFKTSGGPSPKAVSVGATRVPQDARIVVTFDQPIAEDADLAKLARVEGAAGSVQKLSDTQIAYTLNAGLCQAFKLVLDEGLASGINSATSDAWSHSARTVCGSTSVIGYSVQGRPLISYSFGTGSKVIMFTGGIHGEERAAVQTMQAWADYLMEQGYRIPADSRVVVVPNLNPDGAVRGTRNNANDVNLGRNYPSSDWSASIDTARGILPQGGGATAGSEPETKAIMALTQQLRPRVQISFHSQGRLVGANKAGDSVAIGDQYAKTVGYRTMFYNAEAVMGYSITGEYEGWMGEALGTPAILIELPSHNGNYLSSQLPALLALLSV